jgi:hypothetical protein
VDYLGRRSYFSETAHAAIPQIRLSSLSLPVSSTVPIDLDNSQYVSDPDNSYSDLTWSVSGGNQISVQINNSTNVVTFTTPSDDNVQENFQFTVTDPDGFFDVRSVTVSLAPNRFPTIGSTPVQTATTGELYQYTVQATDPDGDPLTFSLTEAPGFLNISDINATSARISGTPNSNHVGSHDITVQASDGKGGTDTQSYTLIVQSASVPDMVISVSLVNYGSSMVKVNWETREETRDYIRYGPDTNYDLMSPEDESYTFTHEKLLRELLPNTIYHYQIISETEDGSVSYTSDQTFTTEEASNVTVFPIPYVAGEYTENDGISFVNLPMSSSIAIYNLMGDLVFEVDEINHVYTWMVENNSGKKVNAGLYIYYIKNENGKRFDSGKLVVIR